MNTINLAVMVPCITLASVDFCGGGGVVVGLPDFNEDFNEDFLIETNNTLKYGKKRKSEK